MKGYTELPTLEQMKDAQELISMCYPIRSRQGSMWFGRNQNFADARFTDYGVCGAFTTAAQALPLAIAVTELVEALEACQASLALMIEPKAIKSSSVMGAFTQAFEADCKARSALTHYRELAGTSNEGAK